MKKTRILLVCALLSFFAFGCSKGKESEVSPASLVEYKTLSDLNKSGVKIGVLTGSTTFDDTVKKFFPEASKQYFNTTVDMAKLISLGNLDAMIADEPVALELCENIQGIDYIREFLEPANYAIAFSKTDRGAFLRDEMNKFLTKIKADGRLEKLKDIWIGADESKKNIQFPPANGKKGSIRLATFSQYPPFSYIKDNEYAGYEIAIMADFCSEYEYGLVITDYDSNGVISAIASGSEDCAVDGIAITEERKETLNFSIPSYDGGTVMIVRSSGGKSGKEKSSSSVKFKRLSDFNNPSVTLGIRTGTMVDVLIEKFFPLAKSEYYNTTPDMVLCTLKDELDGFLADEPTIRYIETENPAISYMKELLEKQDYGFIFPKTEKGEALRKQMNEFLQGIKSDGGFSHKILPEIRL